MTKEQKFNILHSLGSVFNDAENVYFSSGLDWWSAAYLPKYPEHTAGDVVAFGQPSKNNFSISGNFESLVPTIIKFCTFGDMCDYLNA